MCKVAFSTFAYYVRGRGMYAWGDLFLLFLGFDVQVKHPHPHVVQCMNLVGGRWSLSINH